MFTFWAPVSQTNSDPAGMDGVLSILYDEESEARRGRGTCLISWRGEWQQELS